MRPSLLAERFEKLLLIIMIVPPMLLLKSLEGDDVSFEEEEAYCMSKAPRFCVALTKFRLSF